MVQTSWPQLQQALEQRGLIVHSMFLDLSSNRAAATGRTSVQQFSSQQFTGQQFTGQQARGGSAATTAGRPDRSGR